MEQESTATAALFVRRTVDVGGERPQTNRRLAVDLKDIKAIIDLMRKNAISEFELERQDFKIRLKRGVNGGAAISYDDTGVLNAPVVAVPASAAAAGGAAKGGEPGSATIDVKSPMIGTFYRSPSPDSSPYVDIGAEVGPDTVVCIIEAMKVMNEIKAEVRGVITQVLVDNAKPVEFGQPLFKVRPL
ncbi:MAG: acetyl-CoA carboxylase biotin carboxyl carrier protein [Verrucomicrobiales bacterium]|nr:acetyl-CoA carboxylase biotin carboxyl carrier protein [Verrucomicrobiales bacterium]